MRLIVLTSLFLGIILMSACSEERSDIENLDPKILEAEADALSESAKSVTQSKMDQIQPMAIDGIKRGSDSADKNTK